MLYNNLLANKHTFKGAILYQTISLGSMNTSLLVVLFFEKETKEWKSIVKKERRKSENKESFKRK
jgi:hypothetical protein